MNILFPFTDFLWILQKEEYDSARYVKWLKRFFFRRGFLVSERLAYTARAKITLAASALMWILTAALGFSFASGTSAKLVVVAAALILIPAAPLITNVVLAPFFALAHIRAQANAAQKIARQPDMKIVGIAGSFGKTTSKHFLHDLVRFHYRTQMIPGTINTPSGIASWISKELMPNTELLIVEMDAYKKGEIAASARMAPPDIAIVTNIGDQHLERFGSRKALAASLAEIVAHARQDAVLVADKETAEEITGIAPGVRVRETDSGMLAYRGTTLPVSYLSDSNQDNLSRVLAAADILDIPASFVEDTCAKLELPDRRQKSGLVYGYEGIDDSYNISLTTARAGIIAARALASAKGKKLFVVAAGIPEAGPEEAESNIELGRAIAASADQIIVLDSMFARDICEGAGNNIPVARFNRFDDFLIEAPKQFPPSEWVALFEPALPDLYY